MLRQIRWLCLLLMTLGSGVCAQPGQDQGLISKLSDEAILESAQNGRAQSLLVGIVPSGRTVALEHERIKLVQGLWVSRTPENEAAEASALRAFQVSLLADKRAVFAPLQEYGVQIEQDFDSLAVVLVRVPGDALRRILDSSGVRSVSANAKVELN